MSHCEVIAEIGINHNGDLNLAKQLMKMSRDCGADSVKFQKRVPEVCVPKSQSSLLRETPWGEMTYLEYKKRLEFGREEYDEIDSFSKDLGIPWSASAWDVGSLEFLDEYALPFHKVASALNENHDFLREVASRGIPTLVSTGMTTMNNIENIVKIFDNSRTHLTLLHCVSVYPSLEEDLNLMLITTLRDRFSVPVGYSGHEASVTPSVMAAALGASVIERHVTLDRAMWGTDQAGSLEEEGLRRLVSMVRKVPIVLGDGQKKEIKGEKDVALKLRYWLDK